MENKGKLTIIGLGPGNREYLTPAALAALAESRIVVGYHKYLAQIADLLVDQELVASGMGAEVKRCRRALTEAAAGNRVALVCSGDAGLLAMAGLVYELRDFEAVFAEVEIAVLPGITAALAAAAALGAPLTNGAILISLSDLLRPTATVVADLENAARVDLPLCLYNPAGKKRRRLLHQVRELLLAERGPQTPVALMKHISREDEEKWLGALIDLPFDMVDMNTLLVVGNSTAVISNGVFYDRRGYREKYFAG